jgi:SPP1 gp7 family putative phage head morphogenesis protein
MEPGGVGLREFIRMIRDSEAQLGFTTNNPTYLENVYRTATATSYNAGRYRAQTDPDVVEATGLWEYVTAGDNRVRESHAALAGKQWEIGDPQGKAVYPPNGFNDRCVMVVRDRDDASSALQEQVDVDAAIDDGFRGTPGDSIADEALRG